MSTETTPAPKTDKKTEPVKTDPTKPDDVGFSIKLIDTIDDQELKNAMNQLIKQNAEMAKDNKEMKEIITKQQTEKELAKFDKQRVSKLEELEKLHPALAKKHKDTKDLGTLQTAIDTATEFKSDFPEYKAEKLKEKGSGDKSYVVPKQYKA
jgi:hypothetical protein